VYALRSSYSSGEMPEGVEVLICTVDVQKNRLVYVIRGWMPGMSSRLIEFGELWGDTDKPEVWQELDELVSQEWDGHTIKLTGVDAGYRTDEVYAWVRRHRSRARALMGFQKLPKPFRMMKVEVDKQGKVRKRGDKRWDIDSGLAKSWVHNRVRWERGAVGNWLLPADVTEDYCKQIVAEEFDEESGTWNRVSKENHFLDCEGMNYMCARMLRLDRKKIKPDDEEEAETAVTEPSEEDEFEEEEQQEAPVRLKRKTKKRLLTRRKKGNFATSW
ncbi:phage terminase large subunit family protein, partial [Vibrio vulnificus]|nr:phage terminase large subunit family protein [Vibrio vulnificus]